MKITPAGCRRRASDNLERFIAEVGQVGHLGQQVF
jgi:hypothetical protein